MEPDSWHVSEATDGLREFVCQTRRQHRFAILTGADQRVSGLCDTECQQPFGLVSLKPAKFLDREGRQRDNPRTIRFRRLEPHPGLGLLQALNDADCPTLKIYIAPP